MTVIGETPLVGRAAELDRIVSGLVSGDDLAWVIAGPAGVGKSRLAAEVAKATASKGWQPLHVIATRAVSSIPFGAFASTLPELESEAGDLLRLLQRAIEAIAVRNRPDRPLLLVVDDADALDDGSAALLLEVVRAAACRVVATLRTPTPAPDPVTALWKDGLGRRLELAPLDDPDVEQLAVATLDGTIAGTSLRSIVAATAGNPMFVRELLAGAAEHGALRNEDGVWVLDAPLPLPERLVELVAARLDDLGPALGEVVDLLALAEPLGLPLLESLSRDAAVEEAERRGLVAVGEDGRRVEARLAHPLYAEVRRRSMPRARRRRLSAALAEAVIATGARRRDDLLRVARWQLDAGKPGDPAILTAAAASARRKFDLALAARLGRAALESGGGVAAGLALAEAQFMSGEHDAAERVLAGLVPLCRDDGELAAVASARSYNLGFLIGDIDAAERIVAGALEALRDRGARLRLIVRRATLRTHSGRLRLGLDDALLLAGSGDDTDVQRGTAIGSVALALLGRTGEALLMAQRGLGVNRSANPPTQPAERQLIGAVLAHLAAGELRRADAEAGDGYVAGLQSGDSDVVSTFCLLRGLVLVERGNLVAASQVFREGAAVNRQIRDPAPLRWCLGGQALAESMSGDAAESAAAVAELDGLPPHWMSTLELDLVGRGYAWAHVAAGQLSAARSALQEAADRAQRTEHFAAEARLRHDLVRLGDASGSVARLEELCSIVDGELVPVFAAHARAAARGSLEDLGSAARRFEGLGADLLAAEAACEAAAACRRSALLRLASSWDRTVWELTQRCGGVRTPALANVAGLERLTRREREIAELTASGASTRQIAELLFLSRRTAENHLQRAYAKLGVNSRDALAAVLAQGAG